VIIIRCPYCEELRSEEELEYGGEADVLRAADPAKVSDAAWAGYLYFRKNTKGLHLEQWCCRDGCGQWFKVARDTVTHDILEVLPFSARFSCQGEGRP
jgi:sarcosine oxidase, subunit delta